MLQDLGFDDCAHTREGLRTYTHARTHPHTHADTHLRHTKG
jgi:hypothetical protein